VPLYAELEQPPVGGLILDRQLGRTGTYLLSMPDGSLSELGILRGDLLFVEPAAAAELVDGDVVCARVGGMVAIRRLSNLAQGPVLEAAGPDGRAPVALGAAAVNGRVTGLIRKLRPLSAAEDTVAIGVPA
jgi:SOS-response transcriptional repressor LexA